MKATPLLTAAALTSLFLLFAPSARAGATISEYPAPPDSQPQVVRDTTAKLFRTMRVGGPRFGFTVAPDDGDTYDKLKEHGMGRVVSQFGWHFERQIVPKAGGAQFVTQFVPLFGGVEYGKFLPTLTFALGVRLPSGTEFGVGPNFTLANFEGKATSGLMIAVGHSFPYNGVAIPLNLAVTTNTGGTRITLLAGYAIGS